MLHTCLSVISEQSLLFRGRYGDTCVLREEKDETYTVYNNLTGKNITGMLSDPLFHLETENGCAQE